MSGPRTGTPTLTAVLADDRVPFPRTEAPTRCQANPGLFAIEEITDRTARKKALVKATLACSGCPVVTDCLKWALAHKELTPTGVWAATTARQRTALRQNLERRLGPDWVGVAAEQDRRRQERRRAARLAPLTVRETALARLERELIPTRPTPYEPWREPMTPARQEHNVAVLKAALTTKVVA
ncbi:WhiB family transcriptional regulator [Streptomyces sp. NPDC045456]|uniref:WhiB family transcriptional regulator n=1 Tax=Streptomyces sp. NPDC045456 TaxID=3155254 RepID=UPI0033E17BAE